MEEKEKLLLKKAARILISLRDSSKRWILSNLAKANNATFVYTSKIVERLTKLGLVKSEKKGKVKEVSLTEHGQKVAEALSVVVEKPEEKKEAQPQTIQQQNQQNQQNQQSAQQKNKEEKNKKATQP